MHCKSYIFVASNEGRILISHATSLALDLIKPHDRLDHLPPEANVISSSADKLKSESQLKVHMLVRKHKLKSSNEKVPIVCSSDGQSKSNKEQFVNICSNEQFSATCTRNSGDKNYQVNMEPAVCSDKQCQDTPSVHMWPVKPVKESESNHMWSVASSTNVKSIEQSSSEQKNPVNQGSMC